MPCNLFAQLQSESADRIGEKALAGVVGTETRPGGVSRDSGQVGGGIEEDAVEGGDAAIDERAVRASIDEQHRTAPTQADDALHEPTIERGAFHGAFRQDDVGIDEQCRKQLRVGHGRVERAGGGIAAPIAKQLEAFYTSTEERTGEGQR